MIPALILVAAIIVLALFFIFVGGVLVNVGGQEVGIIERRFVGRPLPEGRVVAMKDEVGVQARVLLPGLHVLPPFIYKVGKTEMLVIGEAEVGLIESIDGQPLEP